MDRKIHYNTVAKYFRDKEFDEIEITSFENNKTGEAYSLIHSMGMDVGFFTVNEQGEYVCLDSSGNKVDDKGIYGYVNEKDITYNNGEIIFSEETLNLHYQDEPISMNEILEKERTMYPERTKIVLNAMFIKNQYASELTSFYVDEVVEVSQEEFDRIRHGENSSVLEEYNTRHYEGISDGVHGIVVLGDNGDGLLIDTQGYDYARYLSYAPKIELAISKMLENEMKQNALYNLKLYVPLKVEEWDREYGETYDVEGSNYFREIRDQVRLYNIDDGERGLASYFGRENTCRNKVYSIKPDVEMVEDVMMGVAVVKLTKPLIDTELEDLKDYVTGQFSDGWGESFEQHEIQVDGSEVYVHFWDHDNYFIKTEQEMHDDVNQNMTEGMGGMQGMSGMQM